MNSMNEQIVLQIVLILACHDVNKLCIVHFLYSQVKRCILDELESKPTFAIKIYREMVLRKQRDFVTVQGRMVRHIL
jgi:hypothetical protein